MAELLRVVVVGTGGHAKVVAETVLMDGRYVLAGFVNTHQQTNSYLDYPVRQSLSEFEVHHFIVAIGANDVRARIYREHVEIGFKPISAQHPQSIVSPSADIGQGTLVAAGAIVNPFARIGSNCIINTGSIVEHDCVIEDNVHLAPGAKLAGSVSVGNGAFLGIGSTVVPEIKIGEGSVVGAGSVVVDDIAQFATVAGVPARLLKKKCGSDKENA